MPMFGQSSIQENWKPATYAGSVWNEPYLRLAAAIIKQASREAEKGDIEAAYWLAGEECAWYCELIGYDRNKIFDWLDAKFDGAEQILNLPKFKQLSLPM